MDVYQRFFTSSADLLCVVGTDGYFKELSIGWERCLGYSLQELKSRPFVDFMHPDDRVPSMKALDDYARRRIETHGFENRYRSKDGSYRWLRWSDRSVEEDGLYFSAARDVTELKNSELERDRLLLREQEAVKRREEFIGVASHELRTPLTALGLQVELLRKVIAQGELDRGRISHLVQLAETQVKTIQGLVRELLDVSRIVHGRLSINRTHIDLVDLVRSCLEQFDGPAAQAECELQLEAPRSVAGHWDPLRVSQVVVNLLSNAIRFGAGKPVRVRVWEEDGRAAISVRDQGPGVSPEDAKRIFDRFERGRDAGDPEGFGLGLYIAREIVTGHGGQIRLTSEPGRGAEFTVDLPR